MSRGRRARDGAAPRSRAAAALLVAATVALGLLSRRAGDPLPRVVAAYAGDVLWAAMVLWLLALLAPRARTPALAAGALAIAVAVEASQLWRVPWLDAVRATRAGALALGQGFLWSDLACYAGGVALAALLDVALRRRGRAGRADAGGRRDAGAPPPRA